MTNDDRVGVGSTTRRLGASLLRLGRIRLELLAIEVQEEKERVAALLFWAVLAALAAGVGLVFAALLATVLLWDSHRWQVLAGCALAFAALAGYGAWRLSRLQGRLALPLRASIDELRHDAQALDPREP